MGKLRFLMIHCAATVEGKDIRPADIEAMHMGVKRNANGTVYYKGKKYNSIKDLPDDMIGTRKAKDTYGRGWGRVGYSKFFTIDGQEHLLQDYDEDAWIGSNEYTNGALGMNDKTRHFCYAGGLLKKTVWRSGRHKNVIGITLTEVQEKSLVKAINEELEQHPDLLVCGHNQYAVKGCPSFDPQLWLEAMGIPSKNIDRTKSKVRNPSPFETNAAGNDFRGWVNDYYKDYARSIDLDRIGSNSNDFIMKAYYKLRHKYTAYQAHK